PSLPLTPAPCRAQRSAPPAAQKRRPGSACGRVLALILLTLTLAATGAPAFELVDDDGIHHRIDRPFSRIISLYPAHTENLAEIGAIDAVLGISTSDTYPERILDKPRFSYHDTAEKLIAAAPDCILIRPMVRHSAANLVEQLERFGITVISLQPTTPAELIEYWQTLGRISGHVEGADRMTRRFQQELEQLRRQVAAIPETKRPRVYFESIHQRMRTFSPESIAIFCLTTAGGINIADDAIPRRGTNIADYSKERILAKADMIDMFLAQSGRMNRITVEEILAEPGFGAIKAIREGRVALVEETLIARPTTRLLEGIRRINQLLYDH
ncbi:MAG: ABC transporter substrate-binding protein, partial [Desulfofustis sp.]|nr:ABC transporter substrate-binding protein [Desulfofustis sp.]